MSIKQKPVLVIFGASGGDFGSDIEVPGSRSEQCQSILLMDIIGHPSFFGHNCPRVYYLKHMSHKRWPVVRQGEW